MIPVPSSKHFDFYNDIYKVMVDRVRPTQKLSCHGKLPLYTEQELDRYLALYAGHHYYKLREAFKSLDVSAFNQKNIEIIDWGCGQATGTLLFIEHLINECIDANIAQMLLVEASELALKRGYDFICKTLNNPVIPIRIIQSCIDDLLRTDILSDHQNIKIHILSNILDVDSFKIHKFTDLLKNSFSGVNFFICTSPKNGGEARIDSFFHSFDSSTRSSVSHIYTPIYGNIYKYTARQYQIDKITRYERIFSVNLSGLYNLSNE